jgi:hypothetical protein
MFGCHAALHFNIALWHPYAGSSHLPAQFTSSLERACRKRRVGVAMAFVPDLIFFPAGT